MSTKTRAVLSVSQLNQDIRESLQNSFSQIWISGEVSDLSCPQSGHMYLSLKDKDAQIRAVIWRSVAQRLQFDLTDGMQVVCEGHVDVYPPRGTYQLILRQVEPVGVGALQLALNKLRDKLTQRGMFDSAKKKRLPRFANRIVVVTSPTGAAVRDFLEVLARRWPLAEVTIVPSRVQGDAATAELVAAVKTAELLSPDVIVVTRGGGSLEDLWCFNSEPLIEAIYDCSIPVVSAVGHEIDVTLCDLVADVRALTPTEAAERVVPDRAELQNQLRNFGQRLTTSLKNHAEFQRARLDSVANHLIFRKPFQHIQDRTNYIDDLQIRLQQAASERIDQLRQQVAHHSGKLESLSPLATLARGYSLTQRAGNQELVRSESDIAKGDEIVTQLANGKIYSQVTGTEPDDTPGRHEI